MMDNCDNCGLCCMHMNVPPFTRIGSDIAPPKLQQQIDAYIDSPRYWDEYMPCMWLDRSTGKCIHYGYRPRTCREYERGNSDCVELCKLRI